MHAITLWQPWAWAVAHAGKGVENRTWSPPQYLVGKWLAIHAGLQLDDSAVDCLFDEGFQVPPTLDHGAVVAVARLGSITTERPPVDDPQHRWWFGPKAWMLHDVVALPLPVKARGMRKVWPLSEQIAVEVRKQMAFRRWLQKLNTVWHEFHDGENDYATDATVWWPYFLDYPHDPAEALAADLAGF